MDDLHLGIKFTKGYWCAVSTHAITGSYILISIISFETALTITVNIYVNLAAVDGTFNKDLLIHFQYYSI